MTKYSFVLLSEGADDFLERIEALGLVDITRSTKPVDDESTALLASSNELHKAAVKLDGLDFSKDPDLEAIMDRVDGKASYDNPLESYRSISQRLGSLQAELSQARKEVEDRRAWGNFDKAALDALAEEGLKIRWYCVPKKNYDPSWATLYPLQEVADDGRNVWFVTISDDRGYSLPVQECPAPEGDLEAAEKRVEKLKDAIIDCKARLLELKGYAPEMEKESAAEAADLQRHLAGAGAGKAAEDHLTTFVGFAPQENDEALCKEFDAMDVLYIKETASKEDNPPIKLKNNWFTRQFSILTDMYGRPVYDEFDPTPYLSFFFLLFFAMCMGDAGYGLILIIGGLLLRKSEGMKDLAPLVTILGAGTFIIGIVMHTFFGYDISQAAWVPSFLKKIMVTGTIAGFEAQMVISLGIGIVHLCLAMIVKTVYATRNKGFLESLGVWGWTLLIVGGVVVGAVALAGVLPKDTVKWIVIALGVVSALGIFLFNDIHRNPLKNIGSGLWETYNTVTGLLGDVLSYLRLYALGLAGGMLGKAFNDIAAMASGGGGFGVGWLVFAIIFVIGHALNLAMCCLGAFVHPLRLNFLEFFKNSGYEGRGRVYHPMTNKPS